MKNSKFNKFYSTKPVAELIEQLRDHRVNVKKLDKEWFEALIVHLSEREISTEERKTVNHILSDDFGPIKEIEINSSDNNLEISGINAAGKSLKNIVYTAILLILCATVGIFISFTSSDLETKKNTYIFLGIVSLICNLLILSSLYSAGDHLENS
jgi:hypothetical protein